MSVVDFRVTATQLSVHFALERGGCRTGSAVPPYAMVPSAVELKNVLEKKGMG